MSNSLWVISDCSPTGSSVHGISRQEYWSGQPFPSPGDLPDPGIKPRSPALQADQLLSEPPEKPKLRETDPLKNNTSLEAQQNVPQSQPPALGLWLMAVVLLLSHFQLLMTPCNVAHQAPLPRDSSGKHTGVGCHFLIWWIFLNQGLSLHLPHWQVDFLPLSHQRPNNCYNPVFQDFQRLGFDP